MIEKLNKDVYFFAFLKKLFPHQIDKLDFMGQFYTERQRKMVGEGSLNILLADFVNNLQEGYKSTSQTMLRTISRLQEETFEGLPLCELCRRIPRAIWML